MTKQFKTIEEFLEVISSITIDGSVMVSLKGEKSI